MSVLVSLWRVLRKLTVCGTSQTFIEPMSVLVSLWRVLRKLTVCGTNQTFIELTFI